MNLKFMKIDSNENVKVKTNFNIPIDNSAHISKILNVFITTSNLKIDTNKNKANFNGKTVVKVLYIDTDGMYNSITESENFDENINLNNVNLNSKIYTNNITYEKETNFDENHLKIKIITNINCIIYNEIENNYDIDCKNLISKQQSFDTNILNNISNINFNDSLSTTINEPINKLLFYDVNCSDCSISPSTNYATISGNYNIHIIYENSSNELCTYTNTKPFKQEIEFSKTDDSQYLCKCKIDTTTIEAKTSLEDSSANVNFEFEVQCLIKSFSPLNMVCMEDAFSTDFDLDMEVEKTEFNKFEKSNKVENIINFETEIQESEIINNIVDIIALNYETTNTSITESNVNIEGVLSMQIIYKNEEDKLCSKNIEAPISLTNNEKLENCNNFYVIPNIEIHSCHAKIKRGNILDVDLETTCNYEIYSTNSFDNITKLTPTTPIKNNYNMQIFITKQNEDIWNLCKRTKCSQENLFKYNKQLTNPIKENEKIIVFR